MINIFIQVYADLVKTWGWKSFTIVYDDNEGLIRMSELIKLYDYKGYGVTVRQLDNNDENDYRY